MFHQGIESTVFGQYVIFKESFLLKISLETFYIILYLVDFSWSEANLP